MASKLPAPSPAAAPRSMWAELFYHLYLALACGIALVVMLFTAGNLLNSMVDLAWPPRVQVSETVWHDASKTNVPRPADEVARERAEQEFWIAENARRELVKSGIYLLLAGAVFGFHWRIFRARKE